MINLHYALAEIAGDDTERMNRVRRHLQEAASCLLIIAPDFMDKAEETDISLAGEPSASAVPEIAPTAATG